MLEEGKKYVLFTATESYISKKIRSYSVSDEIREDDRFSHVAGLFYNWFSRSWCVIESHYGEGVVLKDFNDWLSVEFNKPAGCLGELSKIYLAEYPQLKPKALFNHLGSRYALLDVARFYTSVLFHNDSKRNYEGFTCSELLALCDNEGIQISLNKPAHLVRPVDWQIYLNKESRGFINVREQFKQFIDSDVLPVSAGELVA